MAVIEFINRNNVSLDGMLKNLIYVTNPAKTKQGVYVYGLNCDAENAYQDFCLVKELFQKTSGRQHIHFTQSFEGKESPEMIHEIGKQLLQHEIFKGYQVVMSTHTDSANTHNHFVINSVNAETGKKWKFSKNQLDALKKLSDEICLEFHLPIIDREKTTNQTRRNVLAPIKKELYQKVRQAIRNSFSKEEMENALEKEGVKIYWDSTDFFSERLELENILNQSKKYARDLEEFLQCCHHLGVTVNWEKDISFLFHGRTYSKANLFSMDLTDPLLLQEQFKVNRMKLENFSPLKSLKMVENPKTEVAHLTHFIKSIRQISLSKDDFIEKMKEIGISVGWENHHKFITFQMPESEGYSGKKYRNRRLYPEKLFTKETFQDIFSFNQFLKQEISELNIKSWQEFIQNLEEKKSKNLRFSPEDNRIYLQVNEKECFFEKEVVIKFLKSNNAPTILLPSKEEILKTFKPPIIFENKEGYYFSGKSLSKLMSEENLEQQFYNNQFRKNKQKTLQDIFQVIRCSSSFHDFEKKMKQVGYFVTENTPFPIDKVARKVGARKEEGDCLTFIDKNGIRFEGSFASPYLTKKGITEWIQKNNRIRSQKERNHLFSLFLSGFLSQDLQNSEEINNHSILSGDLTKEALKEKRKGKEQER